MCLTVRRIAFPLDPFSVEVAVVVALTSFEHSSRRETQIIATLMFLRLHNIPKALKALLAQLRFVDPVVDVPPLLQQSNRNMKKNQRVLAATAFIHHPAFSTLFLASLDRVYGE